MRGSWWRPCGVLLTPRSPCACLSPRWHSWACWGSGSLQAPPLSRPPRLPRCFPPHPCLLRSLKRLRTWPRHRLQQGGSPSSRRRGFSMACSHPPAAEESGGRPPPSAAPPRSPPPWDPPRVPRMHPRRRLPGCSRQSCRRKQRKCLCATLSASVHPGGSPPCGGEPRDEDPARLGGQLALQQPLGWGHRTFCTHKCRGCQS
mmetsp:Transcript_4896/g.13733  ORF Transcript_4896/g.13733 Transcript_4896/m.13733 type:complete len:202 (-) Transcript_4896:2286-2891(-)